MRSLSGRVPKLNARNLSCNCVETKGRDGDGGEKNGERNKDHLKQKKNSKGSAEGCGRKLRKAVG